MSATAPTLKGKYKTVLAVSWAARHELTGPKRLTDEIAFLPSALSLQESPPHPAPRRLAYALMALFVIAVAWACLGKIDIVAVAPGRIIVSDRTKVIQPLETSVVRRVLVKDGDHVKADQILIELDGTTATADHASIAEMLAATRSEVDRTAALLKAVPGKTLPVLPKIQDEKVTETARKQSQYEAEFRDVNSKLARIEAEVARRKSEIVTARETVAKLQTTLPWAKSREIDFKSLASAGAVPSHDTQDRTRVRMEMEQDLAVQKARLNEAESSLAESSSTAAATLAEIRRALSDRNAVAVSKYQQLSQDHAKAAQRKELTHLRSPVDGVVQQLAVHTEGGVVTEAQALMIVVPETSRITAEVSIANLDIGFVNAGKTAEVKLETFPYTKYGTIPAVVDIVTADAVTDEKKGSYFPAILTLQKNTINVDGKQVALMPGMAITAEIKTGRRRVIEYLLSPIQKAKSESLIER